MSKLSRRQLLSPGTLVPRSDPLVHIVSLLVQATRTGCEAVRAAVAALPGAECVETGHPNKVVIVLETAESRLIADTAGELQQLAGVLTVSIVAHLTERASALDETDESTTVPPA